MEIDKIKKVMMGKASREEREEIRLSELESWEVRSLSPEVNPSE